MLGTSAAAAVGDLRLFQLPLLYREWLARALRKLDLPPHLMIEARPLRRQDHPKVERLSGNPSFAHHRFNLALGGHTDLFQELAYRHVECVFGHETAFRSRLVTRVRPGRVPGRPLDLLAPVHLES